MRGAGEQRKFPFGSLSSLPRPQRTAAWQLSARSLVFLHEFFISGKEPYLSLELLREPAFPSAEDGAGEELH